MNTGNNKKNEIIINIIVRIWLECNNIVQQLAAILVDYTIENYIS